MYPVATASSNTSFFFLPTGRKAAHKPQPTAPQERGATKSRLKPGEKAPGLKRLHRGACRALGHAPEIFSARPLPR